MSSTASLQERFAPKFDSESEKERLRAKFDMAEVNAATLMGDRILVAKWIRESVGRIILTKATRDEDKWQGKVGLVLKVGPVAFTDDQNNCWHGQKADVGDWIVYKYSDGSDINYQRSGTFDQVECKILRETDVVMVIPRPDYVF